MATQLSQEIQQQPRAWTRRRALLAGLATLPVAAGFVMSSGIANASAPSQAGPSTMLGSASNLGSAQTATVATTRQSLVPKTYQPDSSTTGLLPGWTKDALSVRNGDWVVTVPNTVIKDTLINGRLIIRAANVYVSNCWVQGPVAPTNNNMGLVDCSSAACVNFAIEDSVLSPQKPTYGWNGIQGHDYHAARLNICYRR